MNKILQTPPQSPTMVISTKKLVDCLKSLIGEPFHLSGKPRTDGSSLRKLVANAILANGFSPEAAVGTFEFFPPKKKGVPKLIREMLDTYIVTYGDNYNLQVWNRHPNSDSILVKYSNGESIRSKDIRLIFIKVNTVLQTIETIVILTPKYIETTFGKFGKPTIKHQLLILPKQREMIINSENSILLFPDTDKIVESKYLSIYSLKDKIAVKLIGQKIEPNDTKSRGQALERLV